MQLVNTPPWLKKRLVFSENLYETRNILSECGVDTVCRSSLCPNSNECLSKREATFLILGRYCTRSCGFCSVEKGPAPSKVDTAEAGRIIEAVKRLGLKYVVVTSVARDDLEDGGAGQFVSVINALKNWNKDIVVEVLTPDFSGKEDLIKKVVRAKPNIFGHNIETVKRLYSVARNGADYDRSLRLLKCVKEFNPTQITKSGMMLGLGETDEEVLGAMKDLRLAGCDMLTLGQYLRPGPKNIPVKRFLGPEEFKAYTNTGYGLGFKYVFAGPFIRSSYLAEEGYNKIRRVA